MFIMIDGELLNLDNVTAITPCAKGPGCVVQFAGNIGRVYPNHTPDTFAKALISGCVVHYVDGEGES